MNILNYNELANPEFKGKNRDSVEYKFWKKIHFEDYWRGLAIKKQEEEV